MSGRWGGVDRDGMGCRSFSVIPYSIFMCMQLNNSIRVVDGMGWTHAVLVMSVCVLFP